MSAADTPKSKSPDEKIKDAEVVSTPRDDQPVAAKPITLMQQLFIWSMVLLVGVIFGVGSSWTFLERSGRTYEGGVNETDIIITREVAEHLQTILRGSREYFVLPDDKAYVQDIREAHFAAAQGLRPAGADLELVIEEFLAKTMPDSTRTYRSLLAEHLGTKLEVTRPQLARFLADRAASEALYARNLIAPAIPLTVAAEIERVYRTTLTVDQITLSAAQFMQPVTTDDPDIQSTYDKLRATRFTRRAQVMATVAAPDLTALAAAAVISDAEVQAWYDSHKQLYAKPAPAPASAPLPDAPKEDKTPAPIVEYKPLTEVSGEIRATLAREAAAKKGQQAVEDFNRMVEDKNLESADHAAFAAAATAAGLVLTEKLVIDEPQGGMDINLAAFGRIKDPAGIFSKDAGFITSPLRAGTPDQQWFVLRVDEHTPTGYQPLATVQADVQQIVAGRRAYKALLDHAEVLRAAAEKAGPGGLKTVMADPANAVWKATPAAAPMPPLTDLRAPPSEIGGLSGEPRLAISLAMPDRPVLLVSSDSMELVPEVRLVQVATISHDTTQPPIEAVQAAGFYRQQLLRMQKAQFDTMLRDQLAK